MQPDRKYINSNRFTFIKTRYGWANFRNVASLVSGVGIMCIGSGMSIYHGVSGLMHPEDLGSLYGVCELLGFTFLLVNIIGSLHLRILNPCYSLSQEQLLIYFQALAILGGSFISEGATLIVAANQVRKNARKNSVSFREYVWRGTDPSTTVVLLEDAAAVLGVAIAGGCLAASAYTGLPFYDAIGSIGIGVVLGGVASFIVYTNAIALVGR